MEYELLGLTSNSEVKFEEHISKMSNIVNKKLDALHRIANHMSLDKRKMILKAFIEFHFFEFTYCLLIWMSHSRTHINKINRLHEKALRIKYSNFKANFDELLEKDGSFSMRHRNIQTLAIETFTFLDGLTPRIMNEVFQVKFPALYFLRDKNELYSRNPKTVIYGTDSISFLAPKIWSILPQEIKNCKSLKTLKKA